MVQLHKLSFLFVAVVLFFGIPETAGAAGLNHGATDLNHGTAGLNHAAAGLNHAAAGLNHEADSGPAETEQQSAVIPAGTPELFGMHRQGTNAVDLVRVLTLPNAKLSTDEEGPDPGLLSETPLRHAVSIYLCFSRTIHQSLSIRELLFPFHHFL
jgi:hypothetical protein